MAKGLISVTQPAPAPQCEVGSPNRPQDFLLISKLLPCQRKEEAWGPFLTTPVRSGSQLPAEKRLDLSLVSLDSSDKQVAFLPPRGTRHIPLAL